MLSYALRFVLGPHSPFFVDPPFIKTSSYAPAILDLNAISAVPENREDPEFTMPWYRFRTPVSMSIAVLVSGYPAVVECESMLDQHEARNNSTCFNWCTKQLHPLC